MKKYLLISTLMLRVWWFGGDYNGIVVGTISIKDECVFVIREDDKNLTRVACDDITKSEWVEVKEWRGK